MRVTIRDVAREAGVSIATVSRVLNNSAPVKEDKRTRVLAAVSRFGYRPNPGARSLLIRETGGVGVLVPSVSEEFFSEFLTGIDKFTQERDYYLLISSSHGSRKQFEVALSSLDRRVDGLIVMAPDEESFDSAHPVLASIPVVYVNSPIDAPHCDSIKVDNYRAFQSITSHLIDMGHRRIAMIKGPPEAADAQERLRGFRDALKKAGIDPADALEVAGNFTRASGYESVSAILATEPRPTAVAAANDLSALGALSALHEAGISVPDEMSLTGFDDVPSARYATPPLSTVRVQVREMGRIAVKYVFDRLKEEAPSTGRKMEIPYELVLRASSLGR